MLFEGCRVSIKNTSKYTICQIIKDEPAFNQPKRKKNGNGYQSHQNYHNCHYQNCDLGMCENKKKTLVLHIRTSGLEKMVAKL